MTARTAAGSLVIFGGVAIVALSVGSAWYAVANPDWIQTQLAGTDPAVREQLDALLAPEAITQLAIVCGIAGAAEGGLSMLLGWLVLRGRRWAIGTSIAVTFFRLALVGLLAVAMLAAAVTGTSPVDVPTIAGLVIASIVLVATLAFLFLSRRATPPRLPASR